MRFFRNMQSYGIPKQRIEHRSVRMCQKEKVLLWKMYILRKRHWLITLLEIVVPIVVFGLVVHFKNLLPEERVVVYDTAPQRYNELVVVGTYKIAYTPPNVFSDSLMKSVLSRLQANKCEVTMERKSNESEVEEWLRGEKGNFLGVGIIFYGNAENLTYTLRTTTGNLETVEDTQYGEQNTYGSEIYYSSGFTTIQTALDLCYLNSMYGIKISDTTFITKLPTIQYKVVDLLEMLFPTIISLGFTFVMPSLLREIVDEKTSGIKEMMKIMGLNSSVNWLNWMAYAMIVYIPVTLTITAFLTVDLGTGTPIAANFFSVWFLFILFAIAFITLIFATSTFFTNGTIAMITGELIWYGTTMFLDTFVVKTPDKYGFFIKIISCMWPSIALVWAFDTINNFKKNVQPWDLSKLFDDGAGGGRVSVGLASIMLCVDIILFSLITWYVDSVNPGPYGRSKPFTFIFQCFKKQETELESACSTESRKNYESPPKNLKVGIRIENLQKTFNYGKVVAVKNVDLDIYKGNITALLGHNGAGKTTTISMITGFLLPSKGKVIVNGKNIFDNMDEFRCKLGLCPQHNLLFSFLTVFDHLIFFGMLKGLTMKQSQEEGKTLMKGLMIYHKRNELVSKLAGGMQRKLCLAIALMGNPQVLMLDEPTSGLDPESRRHIWDMLLSTRGHRTTIITTHFMEEADVLGDRIAIMDHGQVSCYGTPMYLKKLYGTGYHLNISKHLQSPVSPITRIVQQYVTSAAIKQLTPTQLSYSIKSEESAQFPELFSALDSGRTELGLISINLDSTTIEDVFLKVAGRSGASENTNGHIGREALDVKSVRKTGCGLIFLQFKALVYKRVLIMIRSWLATFIFMAIPVILMAATIMKVMNQDFTPNQPKLLINLISFPGVHIAVESQNQTISSEIQKIVELGQATYEPIPKGISMNQYMIDQMNENLIKYERQMIVGFKFNDSYLVGGFSSYFVHSLPLVLNLISNTVLKTAHPSSSITLYNHPLSVKTKLDYCDLSMAAGTHVNNIPLNVIFVSLGLLILTMTFISFPLKERVSNSKQLQLMTGVSPLLYWLTIFFCDITLYLFTAVVMVCTVFIFQQDSILTASGFTGTLILVLVLFGVSGITFAYFFGFLVKSSVTASVLFVIINLVLGTLGGTFLVLLDGTYTTYGVWTFVFSFNPIFSVTAALIHLLSIMYINGTCLKCGKDCKTQDPFQFLETGPNSKHPHGINSFLIFLAVDAVIYLAIVLIIEYGIAKKILSLVSSLRIKIEENIFEEDLDVSVEKQTVLTSQKLQECDNSSPVLCVNNLGKKYNQKTTAVYGVTFQVGPGECFGLLGVNGAGKSTTFKMLTGKVIPNKGDANVLQYGLNKNKTKFLSKIGYCPQFDAISIQLTGREMLTVFAMLRGTPSADCDMVVSRWIQIMGLNEYADRPCGTYSGGNKRKLSTAMAFIGDPPVVFLDEPTSGVDPVSRRKLWDVMIKCQQAGQTVVLTSHSMEECEALCTKLTIMVAGQMKCIGTPMHLKTKFGQGYTIQVKLHSTQSQQNDVNTLKKDMITNFKGCCIKDEHLGLLHYQVPDPSVHLSELFKNMEHLKSKHSIIEDYIVNDTSLEQVFMAFARPPLTGQPTSNGCVKYTKTNLE